MNQNSKDLASEWFESADSDFQYAEVGLKEGRIFPQVAFLSQQGSMNFQNFWMNV